LKFILKECKTKKCKTNCNSYRGMKKENRKITQNEERRRERGFKYNGNKK
jgi:hypothetical protein